MTEQNLERCGAYLKEIIRLKVNDEEFDISVLEVVFQLPEKNEKYYNMYVYLEDSADMEDEQLEAPTFRYKNTIGVDTAHLHNMKETLSQKYDSAKLQITRCIQSYQVVRDMRKSDLKYQVKKRVNKQKVK